MSEGGSPPYAMCAMKLVAAAARSVVPGMWCPERAGGAWRADDVPTSASTVPPSTITIATATTARAGRSDGAAGRRRSVEAETVDTTKPGYRQR